MPTLFQKAVNAVRIAVKDISWQTLSRDVLVEKIRSVAPFIRPAVIDFVRREKIDILQRIPILARIATDGLIPKSAYASVASVRFRSKLLHTVKLTGDQTTIDDTTPTGFITEQVEVYVSVASDDRLSIDEILAKATEMASTTTSTYQLDNIKAKIVNALRREDVIL